ncbi:MAG: carbohydrate kinase family protein [Patescibacteria group bacterium]
MHNSPTLIFVGYTNIDINITLSSRSVLPGGGAYFAAIAASRILPSIGLVTRIGNDYDSSFLLSRVLPDGVHVIAEKLTAKSIQTYHSDEDLTDRDISLEWGVAPDVNPNDFPKKWLKTVKHIHISTMPPHQQEKFISFLRTEAPQAKISLDTDHFFFHDQNLLKKIKENFSKIDLAFANRHEYKALKEVIDTLPEAIVKFDEDGADYMKKGKRIFHVSTPVTQVKDATGAGDLLAGTYLGLIMKGRTQKVALQKAVELATASVKEVGVAHLFTK